MRQRWIVISGVFVLLLLIGLPLLGRLRSGVGGDPLLAVLAIEPDHVLVAGNDLLQRNIRL